MTTPSPQQQAAIDWVSTGTGSIFVEAVAGAGKTTTLINMLDKTTGYVSFAAYNKKIADEIKGKVAKLNLGNRVRVGTFHSFGLGAWRKAYPSVKVADGHDKTDQMIAAMDKAGVPLPKLIKSFVPKLISLAKQGAAGLNWQIDDDSKWYEIIDRHDMQEDIETDDPEQFEAMLKQGVALAQRGLKWHRAVGHGIVDFDDMLWLPTISGIRLFQVDWVFVDEAQDTNPLRRALARKMLKSNGRAVWVGDRHQAIYGFTGADNDAIDQIIRDFKCDTMSLTVTYRCPKAVVEEAQTVVSHIQAHESAPLGCVAHIHETTLAKMGADDVDDVMVMRKLEMTDAILCRNTKPLVKMAYGLIKRGVACHVEGRDIGMGLLKLVNRFEARSIDELIDKLSAYGEKQSQKLLAKGREVQAAALADRIETIMVIAEGCKDADCVRTKIMDMFQDSEHERKPTLCLSTIHRSKGREWQRVFLLGKNLYMPSSFARQEWALTQESNLLYVAVTRAQSELVYVDVEAS